MIKKTITYVDYNGVERTEDYYFNLNKAELMEWELSATGGFFEMLNRIMAEKDIPTIAKIFKELIIKSYGVKSPDGKKFIKIDPVDGHKLVNDFVQTEAYSILYMELATDSDAAAKFVNGVMPPKDKE